MSRHIAVIGGGAAGFFAAIAAAERLGKEGKVTLLEATAHPLAKVRISGGGRCNLTHSCFDPAELAKRYPRGGRELLGAFHRWQPRDTLEWFAKRGVAAKAEADGRMFPVTDDSATVVDCLTRAARKAGVDLRLRCPVRSIRREGDGFSLELADGPLRVDRVILATGGAAGGGGHALAAGLGHSIEPPVPSLFTFRIRDPRLEGLSGLSVADAGTEVEGTRLRERGPVLVTHDGLSGPGILRLSAWGARDLALANHRFTLGVNWAPTLAPAAVEATLAGLREREARKSVATWNPFGIPGRLWERLAAATGASGTWANLPADRLKALAAQVSATRLQVDGKNTNKEEFVTCGGVRLREVDFRAMESRVAPGLHLAGEVLDIDGVTGGFNFQAAWTTGWLAGNAAAA
ncbi:MAG: aminoacetone oxidase family FAD-binding enzyme [Opitutia bacterium]|jgi:predicted Rossmann fold flavoprotein